MFSHFPCYTVIRECFWKKTPDGKKSFDNDPTFFVIVVVVAAVVAVAIDSTKVSLPLRIC